MYEAAVAHYQATGKHTFLNIAIKNADLLVRTFGPEKLRAYPGHQEVKIGLVKLFRATGNEDYLNLAQYFLDQRGKGYETSGNTRHDHALRFTTILSRYRRINRSSNRKKRWGMPSGQCICTRGWPILQH